MSDFLWPHELQQARLLCPPLSPIVCSNWCPLTQWCYLSTLCSAARFSFCLQSFPASRSFPMSQLYREWKIIISLETAQIIKKPEAILKASLSFWRYTMIQTIPMILFLVPRFSTWHFFFPFQCTFLSVLYF